MPTLINRSTKTTNVTIPSGAAESEAFDISEYASGQLRVGSAWTAASIGFKCGASTGTNFWPIYDHDASIVELTGVAVSRWIQLPPELFGAQWVKLWSQDGAGADTNQAADRTLTVQLKS